MYTGIQYTESQYSENNKQQESISLEETIPIYNPNSEDIEAENISTSECLFCQKKWIHNLIYLQFVITFIWRWIIIVAVFQTNTLDKGDQVYYAICFFMFVVCKIFLATRYDTVTMYDIGSMILCWILLFFVIIPSTHNIIHLESSLIDLPSVICLHIFELAHLVCTTVRLVYYLP